MANFIVTNLNDAGAGSLRAALTLANANADADSITFTVAGQITLTSELTLLNGTSQTTPRPVGECAGDDAG